MGRCERDWDTAADENGQRMREGGAKAEAKTDPESTTTQRRRRGRGGIGMRKACMWSASP